MNAKREGSNDNYGRIDTVNKISFYSAFNSDKCLIHYECNVVSKEKDVIEKDIHLYQKNTHYSVKGITACFYFSIKVDYEPTFFINVSQVKHILDIFQSIFDLITNNINSWDG